MSTSFLDLSKRSNYLVKRYYDKYVIIYEDHRCLINVIKFALEKRLISDPPNLFYFDYHDDFLSPICGDTRIQKFYSQNPNFEDVFNFVEFELSPRDDDWVQAGMELQLIRDAVLIGAVEQSNLPSNNLFTDHLNNNHKIYSISHLWHSLDDRGKLGDRARHKEFKELRTLFDFNVNNDFRFNDNVSHPFILDIDLDCFSTEVWQYQKAVPEHILYDYFSKRVNKRRTTAKIFFHKLVERSEIVTVALESGTCGGISQSNRILNYLNNILFDRKINL